MNRPVFASSEHLSDATLDTVREADTETLRRVMFTKPGRPLTESEAVFALIVSRELRARAQAVRA